MDEVVKFFYLDFLKYGTIVRIKNGAFQYKRKDMPWLLAAPSCDFSMFMATGKGEIVNKE